MYKKYGIDKTVYNKAELFKSYMIIAYLLIFGVILALITSRQTTILYSKGDLILSNERIISIAIFTIINIGAYVYAIFNKEIKKLILAAVSIGSLLSSFCYVLIIAFTDLDNNPNITLDYISNLYWFFIPPLFFILIANLLRKGMRGKGFGKNEKNSGMFGTASFADNDYLKKNGFFNNECLFGKDIESNKLLSYKLVNRTIISKPGGGKTRSVTIPALLSENRPCFVHDPKGELWAVTARYRMKVFKRKIITVDPFGVTHQAGFRNDKDNKLPFNIDRSFVNPIIYTPTDIRYRDRYITSVVNSLVKADSSKNESEASIHFKEQVQIIIGGLLELILEIKENDKLQNVINNVQKKIKDLVNDKDLIEAQSALNETEGIPSVNIENQIKDLKKTLTSSLLETMITDEEFIPTLYHIYLLLNRDISEILKDMKFLMKYGTVRSQQAAATLLTTGENERGSILSSTRRQLMWLVDHNLRETFTNNNIDLKDFISGQADIYIIMPEDQINQQSRCVRMLLSIIQSLLVQSEVSELSKQKYLFILDELGQLDYNPDIEQAISILRGRKCVFWSVFQTLSQIQQYKKPDLFLDTGLLQLFRIGDEKIIKLMQSLGGKQTKLIERFNHGSSKSNSLNNLFNQNISENDGSSTYETGVELFHTNEVRELPEDEQYIFIDSHKPIHCKKIDYLNDSYFTGYDFNPVEEPEKIQVRPKATEKQSYQPSKKKHQIKIKTL